MVEATRRSLEAVRYLFVPYPATPALCSKLSGRVRDKISLLGELSYSTKLVVMRWVLAVIDCVIEA